MEDGGAIPTGVVPPGSEVDMMDWLRKLFDTEGFPARWNCGSAWTPELGWTHIISDIVIWGSYTAIPIVLAIFVLRRKDAPFPKIFWLFVAFIFLCGTVHLVEAVIFWEPVYRLSALVKSATAIVSVATVCALIPVMPQALSLRSQDDLEQEVQRRTKSLQESESLQRVMMSELDHRVKNNITAIMSLADQTMASTGEFDAFRDAFMGRLLALTRTHEALSESRWAGARVQQIVKLTLEPYEDREDHPLHIDGPDVQLDSKAATSLCMSIHELATNSVKYGSLSLPQGTIRLHWQRSEDGLTLTWIERNGPPVTPPDKPGFGTNLIRGMIEHNLAGNVAVKYARDGLQCTLHIPDQHIVSEISNDDSGDKP